MMTKVRQHTGAALGTIIQMSASDPRYPKQRENYRRQ